MRSATDNRGLMMKVIALLSLTLTLAACGPLTMTIGAPGDQRLQTTVIENHAGGNRVAIIDLSGLIYNGNKPALLRQGENPVNLLQEKLENARTDVKVKAVILRLNTPGGTVTASDMMYREVMRFKTRTHKPVIALMMDITASGGYYLACASDEMIAYPTTVVGSIGVIVQTISFKGAMNKIGIDAEAITSGPNKDVGSPLVKMTDEHRAILRSLVDDFYNRFVDIVRQARPEIPADQFARVTDGRVFSGEDALKVGLVDRVGDIHDAFEAAKTRAGIRNADLVIYHRPLEYVGSVYAQSSVSSGSAGTQINLAQFNFAESLNDSSAGFYYLWDPTIPFTR